MNIEYLKLFVRVAAIHNISAAGSEMGLSPAVSSAHLNKLEESLGVRLIHRTTRSVSLTEDGVAFLPHAQEVLETVEVARAAVGAGSILPQGKLRVASSASFGRMHILPALREFLNRYPDISVDMHLSDTLVDMVEGGFDIAIRDAKLQDSSLIAKKMAPVKRIICASPEYLAMHGKPQSPEDLMNHECVSFMGLETWEFKSADGPISIKTKNRLRVDDGEAARVACLDGLGISYCSLWCCYEQLRKGELVQVLEDFPLVSDTDIWFVYPSSRMLAPKVRTFIDFFADRFGNLPYWDN